MRFYGTITNIDGEARMVWGYASTEAQDEQGETVTRDALAAALGDYMRFANIREMHQPSAVGVATEASVDDRGLYLGARIVDGDAWEKVAAGVYKGFSIGGRVIARDPADRSIITGLALTEISVVDRPANPEAVFDCWKAAAAAPSADPVQLAKSILADIVPRLDALAERVEAIARTPLPPATAARAFTAVSKRDDSGGGPASPDDIVAALARLMPEERTLALIKAAHATPIMPRGRPIR